MYNYDIKEEKMAKRKIWNPFWYGAIWLLNCQKDSDSFLFVIIKLSRYYILLDNDCNFLIYFSLGMVYNDNRGKVFGGDSILVKVFNNKNKLQVRSKNEKKY